MKITRIDRWGFSNSKVLHSKRNSRVKKHHLEWQDVFWIPIYLAKENIQNIETLKITYQKTTESVKSIHGKNELSKYFLKDNFYFIFLKFYVHWCFAFMYVCVRVSVLLQTCDMWHCELPSLQSQILFK